MDAVRVARNEATYRRINEGIQRGRQTRTGLAGFLCECGVLGCNQVIELTMPEYEGVRAVGRRFAIVPGHATEHDAVVARTERFYTVEKAGLAADIAEQSDPRGDDP